MVSRIVESEGGLSERLLRTKAVSLIGQTAPETPDAPTVYEYLKHQQNVVFSSDPMPARAEAMYGIRGPIPVSYTGFVTARTPDAFVDLTYCSPQERDYYSRLALQINMGFMKTDMLYVETDMGRGGGWHVKVGLLVPKAFPKHALDFIINNNPPSSGDPDIILVAAPDWVNPAWKIRADAWATPHLKEGAPPKSLMIFDRENYVAYLLGAVYFGEIKKAMLRMAWHRLKVRGIAAPLHASSKEIKVINRDGRLVTTTFAIIGLSGTGKSTLSMHIYPDGLNKDEGEYVRIGHDDSLAIMYDPEGRDRGLIGLEENLYNKTDDYAEEGSIFPSTVVTAENNMLTPDGSLVYGDMYSPNGRCESLRQELPIADSSVNTQWPDYLTIIQKSEVMPPIMLLDDPERITAYYMSVQTKPSTAENISFTQIGRLTMVPGANPFICGPMDWEAKSILKGIKVTKAKALVLNTDNYLGYDIPKEVSLKLLMEVARENIDWVDSDVYDGKVPATGSVDIDGYEKKYGQIHGDRDSFLKKYRMRLDEKVKYLQGLGIEERIIGSISLSRDIYYSGFR